MRKIQRKTEIQPKSLLITFIVNFAHFSPPHAKKNKQKNVFSLFEKCISFPKCETRLAAGAVIDFV